MRRIVEIFFCIVLGSISTGLQMLRDRQPLPVSDEETLYLTERAAGRSIFTFRSLAADLYWIRAIQYFGGRSRIARLRQTDPLAPPENSDTRKYWPGCSVFAGSAVLLLHEVPVDEAYCTLRPLKDTGAEVGLKISM